MNCSRVKIRATNLATLAEFDDGSRIVAYKGSFFEPDADTFNKISEALTEEGSIFTIRDSAIIPIGMSLVILASIPIYFIGVNQSFQCCNLFIATMILVMNIFIH